MIWVSVPGWPLYEVSDAGLVRRVSTGLVLRQKVRQQDGRREVCLYDGSRGSRRVLKVHAIVAAAFLPPRPDLDHDVDHADRDFTNNAAVNLRWLHCSLNRSSTRMDELYGPVASGAVWDLWEAEAL